jgi:hypothetical protein
MGKRLAIASLTVVALLGLALAQAASVSIWPSTATPAVIEDADTGAVELGVKFRSDVAGNVTGIRFYKGPNNTGTHIGNLWSSTGANLGTVTFTGETASGWQQQSFAAPVAITANTTYVASYFAPVGRYSATNNGLASAVDNAPLHALASGASGGNGVYKYSATSTFPDQTFQATNYWVDVVFVPSAGGSPAPAPAPAPPPAPPAPPRTSDHEEGLLGEKCSCGTIRGGGGLLGSFLALALWIAARRRA